MVEQYAGALLYLVPVLVAAVVAFIVTRPDASATADLADISDISVTPPVRPHIPAQRTYQPPNRRAAAPPASLMHAALSSHLAAVSLSPATPAAVSPTRLVSIRRPARIPRRPLYRCPHKP
ncbi:hypothetical protein [Dactylosporangium sp. CA-092794]|uniref:hypothetical protein n=1 Tax=Dactylosporangium sp. CA-092794 TaxID=3239929 RepID=UPI003D8FDEF2